MLEQISWTNIPEPGVYSLFSCGILVGFMLIHRQRRKRKFAHEARSVAAF
jgi:hypothetical protein